VTSANPLLASLAGAEILSWDVRGSQGPFRPARGDRPLASGCLAHNTIYQHQASDPVTRRFHHLTPQRFEDPQTARCLAADAVLPADRPQHFVIASLLADGRPPMPIYVGAGRYTQNLAPPAHRQLSGLLTDERIDHWSCLLKMPTVF
jgi:hypothetical protein